MVSAALDLGRVALVMTDQDELVWVSGYQVTGHQVLTAGHLVKGAKEIRVLTVTSGDWVLAELAWIDEKGDVALLSLSPNLAANRDNLYPRRIISSVKLARLVPEVYVYRDLLDSLRTFGGYREGDWTNPGDAGDQGNGTGDINIESTTGPPLPRGDLVEGK